MKRKIWYIIIAVVAVTCLSLVGLFIYVGLNFEYEWCLPKILFLTSPTGAPTTVMYTYGAQDRHATIFLSKSGDVSQGIQELGDIDDHYEEVIWSKDGTLLVSRYVLNECTVYRNCYDPKTGQNMSPHVNAQDDTKEYRAKHSETIAQLLDKRGGIGITVSDVDNISRKMGYWEWRRFLAVLQRSQPAPSD